MKAYPEQWARILLMLKSRISSGGTSEPLKFGPATHEVYESDFPQTPYQLLHIRGILTSHFCAESLSDSRKL